MIKYDTIARYVGSSDISNKEYNKNVKFFIEKISNDGHTLISCNTIAYGHDMGRLRTEIIYRENQTRTVIVEKASS